MTVWTIIFGVIDHLLVGWIVSRFSSGFTNWLILLVSACVFGGSVVDLMAIAIHECCHGTVVRGTLANKLLALLANVGTIIPIAMGFRRYHSEHHVYQGSATKDPDMPLSWELPLIRGSSWRKLIWLTTYPAMYAVRAMVRGRTIGQWEVINHVFTMSVNAAIWYFWGSKALIYFIVSFAYGYTFHPAAAHFLQEHYTYANGQETYNYYGWSNLLFLNIGFHNEHHDFPSVPARLLPLITKVAPEYYLTLLAHTSWRRVLWSFLTDQNIGPQSRCARTEEEGVVVGKTQAKENEEPSRTNVHSKSGSRKCNELQL
jgi:sphingolipid delta-4 desaturase